MGILAVSQILLDRFRLAHVIIKLQPPYPYFPGKSKEFDPTEETSIWLEGFGTDNESLSK